MAKWRVTPPAVAGGVTFGILWAVAIWFIGDPTVPGAALAGLVMGVVYAVAWVAMQRLASRRRRHSED